MLIAIMGNTFAVRSEIASEIRIRDHLWFVLHNWYLSDLAFEDKNRLKYVITAFAVEENHTEDDNNAMLESNKEIYGILSKQS